MDPGLPPPPRAARQARPLLTLLEVVSLRDPDLGMHGESVGHFAALAGEGLGLPPAQIGQLRLAGILHDIGKIAVPDAILHKPGRLTEEEWAVVRRHPEIGHQLVSSVGLTEIADWILTHHERPDGLGYPYGLTGAEIPIPAAILAVADAYHAMIAERPYQRPLTHAEAREELQRCADTQFDGLVVTATIRAIEAAPNLPLQ